MNILEIRNLSKTFKTGKKVTPVLDDISIDIEKGDIFGVIHSQKKSGSPPESVTPPPDLS